jgi:hypothetical protein
MHMLPIKGILQQLHHVMSDGILRGEALGPGQYLARVERGLLDGEGKRKSEVDNVRSTRFGGVGGICEEGIHGIGEVV